jgi:DNA-directed RNA polymerase specialized sigma24 family protein
MEVTLCRCLQRGVVFMNIDPDQTEFDKLFQLLEPEIESLTDRFRRFRFKLFKFFAWRHCEDPDNLADETIARLLKNVRAGQKISANNPYSYVYAIATNVYKESVRSKKKYGFTTDLAELKDEPLRVIESDCQRECLAELPLEKQELLARYYLDDEDRKQIARDYGLSLNALRLQIFRIKLEMRQCRDECERLRNKQRN